MLAPALEAHVPRQRQIQPEERKRQTDDPEHGQRRAVEPDLLRVDQRQSQNHAA